MSDKFVLFFIRKTNEYVIKLDASDKLAKYSKGQVETVNGWRTGDIVHRGTKEECILKAQTLNDAANISDNVGNLTPPEASKIDDSSCASKSQREAEKLARIRANTSQNAARSR